MPKAMTQTNAHKLNELTGKMTAGFARVEKALAGLRFGVECSIAVDGPKAEEFQLGYGKACGKGEWRLFVDTQGNCRPLADASRELRIAAIKHLPKLLDELQKQASILQMRIEAELPSLEHFADCIEQITVSAPPTEAD